jgi:hypothetical protein
VVVARTDIPLLDVLPLLARGIVVAWIVDAAADVAWIVFAAADDVDVTQGIRSSPRYCQCSEIAYYHDIVDM